MHKLPLIVSTGDTWTAYDGDDAYRDYTVSSDSTVTSTTQYEPGVWNTAGGSQYLHNNHLGTLQQTTDSSGVAGSHRVFTAFGEPISTPNPADRFGFVGAEGYQATIDPSTGAPAFLFLHLGARYYDPASGRFLQRDPVGTRGGSNVYAYAGGTPTAFIDPPGLSPDPSGPYAGCGFGGPCGPATPAEQARQPKPPKPPTDRSSVCQNIGAHIRHAVDWVTDVVETIVPILVPWPTVISPDPFPEPPLPGSHNWS